MSYKDIKTCPKGFGNFFLVKPKGSHKAKGLPFLPTVVQECDGEFYSPMNECELINFGQYEPLGRPLHTILEWTELPE